jgi:hypothetical protein
MTDHPNRTPGEEPPFVSSLLTRSSARIGRTTKAGLGRVPRSLMFMVWGVGPVVVFAGILVLSVRESPNLQGVLSGLFGGLFAALLVALGMGMLVLWLHGPARRTATVDAQVVGELERLLAPTLRELERARTEVIRKVKARSVTRVPAGMAAVGIVWVLGQWGSEPPDVFDLVMWTVVGALAGEAWAIGKLDREYRRLYKERVLPHLAQRFGDLTYRHAAAQEAARARARRILKDFERVKAEDEIAGTYHGIPVSIVETRLESGSGDSTRVVFDGLLVELTLPRNLTGTTLVVSDAGLVGNLKAQWRSDGLQCVRLEDPRFEKRYEVYSSDQIEARALLTPAFMERFMALARLPGLAPPGAIAEGNRLITALPKRMPPKDLFEPPAYWKPSGGKVLLALSQDIEAVLAMADSVIELDFWAAGVRRGQPG